MTNRGGQILGATIVSAAAGELIAPWTLAVQRHLDIRAMAELVLPYPTLAEVSRYAATANFAPGLTRPMAGRIMRWLRRR